MHELDSIEKTLLVTQNLLCALEQDSSLLHDVCFMRRLSHLRSKHKDTIASIASNIQTQRLQSATYHKTPGCNHYWSQLPISDRIVQNHEQQMCRRSAELVDCSSEPQPSTSGFVAKTSRPIVRDAAEIVRQKKMQSEKKVVRPAPPAVTNVETTKKVSSALGQKSLSLHDLRKSTEKLKPHVTIPKPFNFTKRKIRGNTYAQKFLNQMLDEKEKEENEREEREAKRERFKANPVPKSTYESTNPLVKDEKYAESIRRRLQANMLLKSNMRKSQSMGDISLARPRPVPTSTYVSPMLPNYHRAKSASQRAIHLLDGAREPAGLQEHAIRTNIAFNLRHAHCRQPQLEKKFEREDVPDFQKLHQEFNERQRRLPQKPPTIPIPFKLSESKVIRHRQCLSSSPPRAISHSPSPVSTNPPPPVHVTHASSLRDKAIKEQIKKLKDDRSQAFWEERRVEAEVQREQLQKAMKSSSSQENMQIRVQNKIRSVRNATREYEKQLEEMKKRVMARPLIMEQQSALVQKHRLEKKYRETMSALGTFGGTRHPPQLDTRSSSRRESAVSEGTYTVKRAESNEYASEFESDEESRIDKKSPSNQRSSQAGSSTNTPSTSSFSSSSRTSDSTEKADHDASK